jgi:NAD dependent epimerase/dehydratase family enzyme
MDEETGELGGNEPDAPDTWNFSIDVAKGWEQAFFSKEIPGVRKVAMRSAVTLSPDRGGAFDLLLGLVRAGLGGTQGGGDQFVSWVHEFDFARAVQFIVSRPELSGAVNIASPNPLPNREFMRTLR